MKHKINKVVYGGVIGAALLSPRTAYGCNPVATIIADGLKTSPFVLASEQGVVRADGVLDISRADWRPQLSVFARTAAGDSGFSQVQVDNSTGVRASQRLFDFGKSKLQKQSAVFSKFEAESRHNATRAQEALIITIAYIDGLEASSTIDALQAREIYLTERVQATTTLLERGATTRADLAEAKAEFARSHADVLSARYEQENARARLLSRMAYVPEFCSLSVVKNWMEAKEGMRVYEQGLTEHAIARNPLIAAERANADMLQIDATLRKRSRLPVIELVGTSSYAYDQFNRDWGLRNQVGIEVNVPLVTGGRQKASQSVARADANAAKFRALETARALRQDVLVTSARIDTLALEITAREEAKAAAQEQFDAAMVEYELGAKTFSELVDVRLRLDQAILYEIRVRHNHVRQLATLTNWTSGLVGE